MNRLTFTTALLLISLLPSRAQPGSKLTFEVATIKPFAVPQTDGKGFFIAGKRGGPGTDDPAGSPGL